MCEDGHPEGGPARERAARGLQADQETGHILPGDSLSLQHLQVNYNVDMKKIDGTLSDSRLDQENRSVAHYLAWMGCDESLQDILSIVPTLGNFQDIYGETPLMLAVR